MVTITRTIPKNLTFTVQVFREGNLFVSYNPELDVSSCGETIDKAKMNLRDAMKGFLKSAAKMGTLAGILEEAGYIYHKNRWSDPELIVMDRVTIGS